jgi:1-pyrroline-5-carboxylate dehydrogenase
MSDSRYIIPNPVNEPVKSYAPGSPERAEVKKVLADLKAREADIPMIINGREVRTGDKKRIFPPHDKEHTLGYYHQGGETEIRMAIDAALEAKKSWMELDWGERASIFLKAADMLAGPYRAKINAATMLGQSKTVHQAEIDSACELIDFYRFNVKYLEEIYEMQPNSSPQQWNSIEWRPLEGFIFALTPFNFTSIAGNLQTSASMMGNTIVWKASKTQI